MVDQSDVTAELGILKLLIKSRIYFDKYYYLVSPYIKSDVDKLLYQAVGDYYTTFGNHDYISQDELSLFFCGNYSHSKQFEAAKLFIDVIYDFEISSDNIKQYIHKLLVKEVHKQIETVVLTASLSQEYNKLEEIQDIINTYQNSMREAEEEASPFFEMDIFEYAESEEAQQGLRWRLHCLNKDCGLLTGGTLVHVFAYPETGKTTFISSEATYWSSQLKDDEILIWFNNEQAGKKVKERIFQSCLNAKKHDILADVDRAVSTFKNRGGDRIKLVDKAVITIEEIRLLCSRYNVKGIIVDQGDKVTFRGSKDLEGPARLKALYVQFREIAKEFNIPVITVGQASAEAVGKKWLDMSMTENSKVGKAAEMDLEIGIGCTQKPDEELLRFLHICKNKNTGIHGKHTVVVDVERGRYGDMA